MHILKLDATESTNTYLKGLVLKSEQEDYTVVVTSNQSKGRGQKGGNWESEPGKNLTFSTLKKFHTLSVHKSFLLNICTSLAIYSTLQQFSDLDLKVKWPNDIMSGNSKICGILIENLLLGTQIRTAIIGIGLNVNQLSFNTNANAVSLKMLLGQTFNLDELLLKVIEHLKDRFLQLSNGDEDVLWNTYEKLLYRKDRPSAFSNREGVQFMGIIRGVSRLGKLKIELEDGIYGEYDLKEVQLLN